MMNCSKCGNGLDAKATFCAACGTPVGVALEPVVVPQPQPTSVPNSAAPVQTNGLAIASLVLSVIGCTSLIGAILGHVALAQINRTNENGKGLALAGVIVGWVWTLFALWVWASLTSWTSNFGQDW